METLPNTSRLVVEYTLSDALHEVSTAYTQSFFEIETKEHLNWLVTQIFIQLKNQLDWVNRGSNHARQTYARVPHERTRSTEPTVPITGVVQNRRDKSLSSQRRISKSDDETDSKPVYAEDVPAGLF
jgi:hypothetical protein